MCRVQLLASLHSPAAQPTSIVMRRLVSSSVRRAVGPSSLRRVPVGSTVATLPVRSVVPLVSVASNSAAAIATSPRSFATSARCPSGSTVAAPVSAAPSAALPLPATAPLQLHGTPLSHFTRRIRILLCELGVPFEFVRSPSVLAASSASYAHNPLLRVPSLVHGSVSLIDSDHIARYLASLFDPQDRLSVLSTAPADLNALAVMTGVMDDEVTLILAKRGGMTDAELAASRYFTKRASAINNGLQWIEQQLDSRAMKDPPAQTDPLRWSDITLVCMWQHLSHASLPLIAPLDRYPRIAARVAILAQRDAVASTGLERSLAEAKAAGWVPG